jgi:sulfite reductase alpha subunit-like flavoprotein
MLGTTMLVKAENESVSLTKALEEMSRAVDLLKTARLKTEAWHDPVQLLDSTAHALDDAALALKTTETETTNNSLMEEEFLQALLLKQQCEQVIAGRQAILTATAIVLARPTTDNNTKRKEALIVWATHTGMSKKMAHQLKRHMGSVDAAADAVAMNIKDLTLAQLEAHDRVYFCVSTFGCGRPPRDAEAFLTALQLLNNNGPDNNNNNDNKTAGVLLFGLQIAVAAFGNSLFADTFCKFGRTLSEQLCQLGAREVLPLATMDAKNGKVEQQRQFEAWQEQVLIREGKVPVVSSSTTIAETDDRAFQKEESTTTSCCTIL